MKTKILSFLKLEEANKWDIMLFNLSLRKFYHFTWTLSLQAKSRFLEMDLL